MHAKSARIDLHEAAFSGNIERVRWLLQQGQDPSEQTKHAGQTALHRASMNGNIKCAKVLIEFGAHTDVQDHADKWKSPKYRKVLCWLCWSLEADPCLSEQHIQQVLFLLLFTDKWKSPKYRKVLCWLCWSLEADPCLSEQHIQQVLFLLLFTGCSPLHYAAGNGHLTLVKWLTQEEEVALTPETKKERTPRTMARRNGHRNVVQFLTEMENKEAGFSWLGSS